MLFTKALSLGNQLRTMPINSALCHIAQSHDSELCRIAQSHNSAVWGIARSLKKKFRRRLRTMQLNLKFNSKFSS
jgi:hypothetical protein